MKIKSHFNFPSSNNPVGEDSWLLQYTDKKKDQTQLDNLELLIKLGICFPLATREDGTILYLFPSFANESKGTCFMGN